MVQRVVLGKVGTGDYRLRVSRPGYNVMDLGLARQNVFFDTEWLSTLLVLAEGSVSVTYSFGTSSYGVQPNILTWADPGFIPVFLPSINLAAVPGYAYNPRAYMRFGVKRTGVDYIQNTTNGGGGTFTLEYLVLRAPEGGVIG